MTETEEVFNAVPTLERLTIMPNTIHFSTDNLQEPIMKLSQGYFWYRGEKIEDIHQVYERFNEWLVSAGYPK